MSVRIGWSLTRPRERKRGQFGGGVWIFELLKVDTDVGRGSITVVGLLSLRREDLERMLDKGLVTDVTVVGVLSFASDVTPDLARRAIGKRRVIGIVRGRAGVREVA